MLPNDALGAAVIGGLLTGAGTLLGALILRWLDIRRENRKIRRQVGGAINALLAEMAANEARLETQVKNQQWMAVEVVLSTSVFHRVELILAEHLGVDVRAKVFEAYAPIEGGDIYDLIAYTGPGGITTNKLGLDLKRCAEIITLIDVAGDALSTARDDLLNYEFHRKAWGRLSRLLGR
jgi:hypothetical protein